MKTKQTLSQQLQETTGVVDMTALAVIKTQDVNMTQEIDLDETKPGDGEIITDSLRQYRADCQAGQFKVGAQSFKGSKLDLELVGAQVSEGEFFGYPNQKWLALLFVDGDGVLSSVLFKTESLSNFEELRRQYRVQGQSLLGKTVRATMSKRSSRAAGTSYFAVEFEVVNEGRYANAIKAFRDQGGTALLQQQLMTPSVA